MSMADPWVVVFSVACLGVGAGLAWSAWLVSRALAAWARSVEASRTAREDRLLATADDLLESVRIAAVAWNEWVEMRRPAVIEEDVAEAERAAVYAPFRTWVARNGAGMAPEQIDHLRWAWGVLSGIEPGEVDAARSVLARAACPEPVGAVAA